MTTIKQACRCETCRYFDGSHCRRHAPGVHLDVTEDSQSYPIPEWPLVNIGDWCGEWRARDETEIEDADGYNWYRSTFTCREDEYGERFVEVDYSAQWAAGEVLRLRDWLTRAIVWMEQGTDGKGDS